MSAIKGTETNAVMVLGTTGGTYATAVAGSTGDKITCQVQSNISSQELVKNAIGSGLVMNEASLVGMITPMATITGDAGVRNGFDKVLAQFFGTASAPAEQTPTKGDYMHRLTLRPAANYIYNTFSYQLASGDTLEFPSCAVKNINVSCSEVHSILQYSAELLGNTAELSSSANDAATVIAATIQDSEVLEVKQDDDFWINAQSDGALDSGDQINITSFTITYDRPQDFIGNIKGSAGNPEPTESDLISATLTVTMQEQADKTYWTAWSAETTYKARINVEGSLIASGSVNKAFKFYFPVLKLIDPPDYSVTDAGFNTVTLNFKCFVASAAPTGMNSVYPYVELINTRSANYIS